MICRFTRVGHCFYHQKIVDPKTGEEKPVTIIVDNGIRPNTNMADLAKLEPSFKNDGTTTADGPRSFRSFFIERDSCNLKGFGRMCRNNSPSFKDLSSVMYLHLMSFANQRDNN